MAQLFSRIDLAHRWDVSRTMVWHYEQRFSSIFPKPVMHVNCGNVPLYRKRDVVRFEKLKGITMVNAPWEPAE